MKFDDEEFENVGADDWLTYLLIVSVIFAATVIILLIGK